MNHSTANACDENLLDRYIEGDLCGAEKAQMEIHLAACPHCHRQVAAMAAFAQNFRSRIQQATAAVDYMSLEKEVIIKTLRQPPSRSGLFRLSTLLKYTIPAAVMAGGLLFFTYFNDVFQPLPAPSAIINSFTGAMSSVMIFETPETRQTILWYHEDANLESE
jgi:anti-sigma factor RsiW